MTDLQGRPLLTLVLFAYNQENYMGKAVEAALAQTYEELRSIVSGQRQAALLNRAVFSSGFMGLVTAVATSSSAVSTGRKMKLMLIALFCWLYNFKIPSFTAYGPSQVQRGELV